MRKRFELIPEIKPTDYTQYLETRMHGDYCAPAVRVLHEEVAAPLPHELKAGLG